VSRYLRALLLGLAGLLLTLAAGCGGSSSSSPATTSAAQAAPATDTSPAAVSTAPSTSNAVDGAQTTEHVAGFSPRTPGVLTVGIDLPNPAYVKGTSVSNLSGGYESDLVNEIAKRLGIPKVKWVLFPFNALVAGKDCPCDFSVGGVSIFPDRQKVVDFSSPYYTVNQAILVRKGTTVADLAAAKALQWGAQKDSSGLYYLDTTLKPAKKERVYPSFTNALLALVANQVQAVIIDANIAEDEAASKPQLEVVGQFATDEKIGAVLTKGSPNTPVLSKVIAGMQEDGFLESLVAKYYAAQASSPVLK
jgi:polar amino acid transport system substrate-binding protein